MDPFTAAVTIVGLQTVGRPSAEALKAIVGKILSPSLDAVGQGLASPLQAWARQRGENATQLLMSAAETLQQANVDPQVVPGRILMPILEKGSLEEDNELRKRWSRLLATSANPTTAHTVLASFPYILSELSPLEVQMLDFVYVHGVERSGYHAFKLADVSAYFQVNSADTIVRRDNLERLKLIAPTFAAIMTNNEAGEPYTGPLYLTSLGYAFIQACTQ